MGIEATITVVPRSEVRKKSRAPDLARFELYKEWGELDVALDQIGGPAAKALRGNVPMDDDVECDLIRVPPALVKRISKALVEVSDEKLLQRIDEDRKATGWRLGKREHKTKLDAFSILKDAYRLASSTNAYLEIFIG